MPIEEVMIVNVTSQRSRLLNRAMAVAAVGFGLLTIKEGGTVLFGGEAAQASAGNYVPFVLWFNFLAGFAYIIAGAGLWLRHRRAAWLAVVIATTTALAFAAFGAHVYAGGAYEMRTVAAMSMRTLVWVTIAAIAWRGLRRTQPGGGMK